MKLWHFTQKNRPIQLVNFYNSHFNKLSGWLNKKIFFFEALTFDKQYLLTFFMDMSSIWNDSSYLICTLQEQREEKCPFEIKTATLKVKTRWNLLIASLIFWFSSKKNDFCALLPISKYLLYKQFVAQKIKKTTKIIIRFLFKTWNFAGIHSNLFDVVKTQNAELLFIILTCVIIKTRLKSNIMDTPLQIFAIAICHTNLP